MKLEMSPKEILALPELTKIRAEIQSAYAYAMEQAKRAGAVARAIEGGHVQASAYNPNNTPLNRQASADAELQERWRSYDSLCARYAKRVDALYAENGHVSRRWVEFDSPEAKARAAKNDAYLRLRGQYLPALNHGVRGARITAIAECELRMRMELGEDAATRFVKSLDQGNAAIYRELHG
jgi:hypothetical protein